MIKTPKLDRRKFLAGSTAAGALSFTSGAGILTALGNSKAFAADVSGYKAIVCVFFFGGQDGHDTVLPYDQENYDSYVSYRTGILAEYAAQAGGSSRDRDRLLQLVPDNAANFPGREFALPEALEPLKTLFDAGEAAIIGNVGPLVEPINAADFEEGIKARPKQLFSHNDQQSTWMSSAPEGEIFGWGGKFADVVLDFDAAQDPIFTAISTFGNTVFLAGDQVQQFNLGADGPQQVNGLENFDMGLLLAAADSPTAVNLLKDHYRNLGIPLDNLFEQDVAAENDRAFTSNEQFSDALDDAQALQTTFPQSQLGTQLKTIAETINIRGAFNMSRQVFFVGMGGFDTHDNQANDLTGLHTAYANAIAAFYQATTEMGLENDVTLFTASDFGRALVENGNGTDHGWGSHHFVVGGGVDGRKIFGDIPPYTVRHDQDSGNGRLIPTTSVEQYAATLGRWFGLTDGELMSALPALANFSVTDLGFMGGGSS